VIRFVWCPVLVSPFVARDRDGDFDFSHVGRTLCPSLLTLTLTLDFDLNAGVAHPCVFRKGGNPDCELLGILTPAQPKRSEDALSHTESHLFAKARKDGPPAAPNPDFSLRI
jgi:hypothetical protein